MFKKIALFVSFLLLAIAVSVMVALMVGRHDLVEQEKEWIALGGTLDPADLAPPEMPDAENAAVAYEPVFVFFDELTEDESNLLGADPAEEPNLIAVLDKSAEVIAQLRNASRMEKCRWDIHYEEGINVLLPHLGQVRNASRLLTSDARRAAAEGRDEDAVRDIETILRLGLHVSNDQTLVGQLVTAAVLNQGVLLYEDVFRNRSAPLNDIAKIAVEYDSRALFRRALMGEVATMRQAEREAMNGRSLPPAIRSFLVWDRVYYLRTMRHAVIDADKPFYDAAPLDIDPPFYAFLSSLVLPALDRAAASLATTQLWVTMLQTAEKLRAYKAEHEAYPETGSISAIKMPIDPVTGRPLIYERLDGGGFVLTSEVKDGDGKNVEWRWN